MRLEHKVVVVTGGAQGFGEGIVRRFAAEGAKLVIADLQYSASQALAQALQMRSLADASVKAFGRVDVVINNAGTSHRNQSLMTVSEAEFDRVFSVNVKSIYWSAQAFVGLFRAQGGGAFINIASTAGVRPRPGLVWYNSTKGAVITASKAMAVELAADRIRVNVINPVAGETPLLGTFMGEDTPEMRAKFIASIPLGRLSRPQDIAHAALYLASDEAEFITGACLEVDGGRCV
ncbi:MAG: glucose 1-dehydrogenase [Betaproteobacteria bacterium]|nr:glucose 1-dehydrogenase [Betaproteobacteria bacterium]